MCEFCTSHGEGKKWYENASLYSEEVFRQVHTHESLVAYLRTFRQGLERSIPLVHRLRQRMPRIYDLIAAPLITRNLKKTHFGQVVTIEDVEGVLKGVDSVVRLPCICRKVTIKAERRYCFGLGFHLQPALREVPDFSDFEVIGADDALEFMRTLDDEGQVHSVWTFNTPLIGAICNCDRDCMAYRYEKTLSLGKVMWKGEAVAHADPILCEGCGACEERCLFGAITIDSKDNKCIVEPGECYGCGVCRNSCPTGAITMSPRPELVPF